MASEQELQKAKAKLAALNAINSALTKENEELRDQLEDLRDQLDHASEPKSASGAYCSSNSVQQQGPSCSSGCLELQQQLMYPVEVNFIARTFG